MIQVKLKRTVSVGASEMVAGVWHDCDLRGGGLHFAHVDGEIPLSLVEAIRDVGGGWLRFPEEEPYPEYEMVLAYAPGWSEEPFPAIWGRDSGWYDCFAVEELDPEKYPVTHWREWPIAPGGAGDRGMGDKFPGSSQPRPAMRSRASGG